VTVPQFGPGKYDAEGLFSPADAVTAQGDGSGLPAVPDGTVLGCQEELTAAVRERAEATETVVRSQELSRLGDGVGYVPVHENGVGAPVAATVTENLVAGGVEAVIMLGGGAAVDPGLAPDAAVLPTRAVRDEGISHHYLPSDVDLTPTPGLVDALDDSLSAAGFDTPKGATWTMGAIYRETMPEIRAHREAGVRTLCMETAAIRAVCRYRGVDTATAHGIGDYLDPDGWAPDGGGECVLPAMLDPVVEGVRSHVDDR